MKAIGTVILALLLALACDQEEPLQPLPAFPNPAGAAGMDGMAPPAAGGSAGTIFWRILPSGTAGTVAENHGGIAGNGAICGTGGVVTPPTVDIDQLPCEIADGALGATAPGTPEEDAAACVTEPGQNGACPRAGFTCGEESPCVCHLCKYRGGELYLNRWICY
jgi:hypothetical protein